MPSTPELPPGVKRKEHSASSSGFESLPSSKRLKLDTPKRKKTTFLDLPPEIRQKIILSTVTDDMIFEGLVLHSSGPVNRGVEWGFDSQHFIDFNIDTFTKTLESIHPIIAKDM